MHDDGGAEQRQQDGEEGCRGGAHGAEREPHDHRDQQDGENQCDGEVLQRAHDADRLIIEHQQLQAGWRGLADFAQGPAEVARDSDQIAAGRDTGGEIDGVLPRPPAIKAAGGSAERDSRNRRKRNGDAAARGNRNTPEIGEVGEARPRLDRDDAGGVAQAAGGGEGGISGECRGDGGGGNAKRAHARRIECHADRRIGREQPYRADMRHGFQARNHVGFHVARHHRVRHARRIECRDVQFLIAVRAAHQIHRRDMGGARQVGARGVHRRERLGEHRVGVDAAAEIGAHMRHTLARDAGDIGDAVDRRDIGLDGNGDEAVDHGGGGAGIMRADLDAVGRDWRAGADRQRRQRDQTEQDQRRSAQADQDRMA